ncbi:MAG: hypothetical protein GWP08_19380 [Nitrospiraceae bacterium]|nr:hypothetical protein [Nitrospiraceae bacterium]
MRPGGFEWALGIDSSALYPEYWTDPNIMLCPSDARDDSSPTWMGTPVNGLAAQMGIEQDVAAQLQSIDGSGWECQAVRDALLSWPISYLYMPYAAKSMGQMIDVYYAVGWAYANTDGTEAGTAANQGYVDGSVVEACGGPAGWPNVQMLHGRYPGSYRCGSGRCAQWGGDWADDNGDWLPESYNHLREGIERFFITDINNPAASSAAQSTLPIMWDAWSGGGPDQVAGMASTPSQFNHIPGGSNVLYMDGHVRFLRYKEDAPLYVDLRDQALQPSGLIPAARWAVVDFGRGGGYG